ncbi:MAG: helix-turn-helix transcriptional regulator [Oscillospiraceae bacterium]|nr:helix-turn-helix transcriptional regulator [Oscillospiraceae bacterium]
MANKIKEFSKLKNISLKNILENCNLDSNTFSHMLHGKAIAFDSLAKIADYLDCSVDYLLGRTDNPDSHKL